jgi:hypothetical protein
MTGDTVTGTVARLPAVPTTREKQLHAFQLGRPEREALVVKREIPVGRR